MIREIRLRTFKCFEDLRLPISPLTLLTGMNAGGKSTVQQALLLLHQGFEESESSRTLMLSGPKLNLGTLRDVVDKVHGRRRFGIGLSGGTGSVDWVFESESSERDQLSVPVKEVAWRSPSATHKHADATHGVPLVPKAITTDDFAPILRAVRSLRHVPADRIGPAEVFRLEDESAHQTPGPRAERSVGALHWFGSVEVEPALRHPDEHRPTLLHQTEAWLGVLFPGATLQVLRVNGANLVSLGIRTSTDTDFHRPQHVGFGLTHVLPVLVSCLLSKAGDLVLVENPEAHLHPRAQASIAEFLAKAASAGVQVVIESHSDHVLNGIRRAVLQKAISPHDVQIHFFRPRGVDDLAQVVSPRMDPQGQIDSWPEGFFDQFEKDLSVLAGL